MKALKSLYLLLGPIVFAAAAGVPVSAAENTVEVGILNCQSVPGSRLNLLVRSTVDVECTFKRNGETEQYIGETGIALGLDLSFRSNERFAFTVVSASDTDLDSHEIAGKYIGGKAGASLGAGLGAAALVGGSNDAFGLNPLALETNQGFGISGGIGFLYIQPAP